jgi:hypothetical protein
MFLMRRERVDALPSEWREALTSGTHHEGDVHARAQLGDELMVSIVWEDGHAPPALSELARL